MKRIECENEGCSQTLGAEEVLCAECGHQQTTRGWALVLLLLYYPVVAALVGLFLFVVVGLLFAGRLPLAGLAVVGLVALGTYAWLATIVVRRYLRRKRRIERAKDVEGYG